MFNMGPLKDPDPDGLHPIFYHSKWDVVGPVVCSLVKEAFRCPMKVEEINETLIVLTPNVSLHRWINLFLVGLEFCRNFLTEPVPTR